MRSVIYFFMDKKDEEEFIKFILSHPDTCFTPRHFITQKPPQITDIDTILAEKEDYFIGNSKIISGLKTNLNRHNPIEMTQYHHVIHFFRSEQYGNLLTGGYITVATTDKLGKYYNQKTSKEVEILYKRIRNWIRKNYDNNLVFYRKGHRDEKFISKIFWLGNHARQWLQSDTDNILEYPKGGNAAFRTN